jgi:hypothetical protein
MMQMAVTSFWVSIIFLGYKSTPEKPKKINWIVGLPYWLEERIFM